MKRLPITMALVAGILFTSCSKKSPEFVNSIPDDAIGVMSMQPMQLHTKGKLNSLEGIKERVKDEIWGQLIENPLSTGLMLDEYVYVFLIMEEEAPVIGVISGMKNVDKFESTIGKIDDDISSMYNEMEGYTYIQPDKEGAIAWNQEQMILLVSPDNDQFEISYWTGSFDSMFNPVKEESITSLVDFRDFLGKMKDLNLWISSDDMRQIVEKMMPDDTEIELPVQLYNNYAQVYIDFTDGEMNITGETHFSEEVEKNLEEILVMNPSLNEDMLGLAPGGDLLMAVAGSMNLEKVGDLAKKLAVGQLEKAGKKVEEATGVPAEEIAKAFTGDFTISVNGIEGDAMIPLEVFIGLGVNSETVQEKLMETVQGLVPVDQQGDFFVMNVQGMEVYSGIIDDMWVITNAKGYKEAVGGGTLDKSLRDSKFNDFADGSMGVYVNLDLNSYPSLVNSLLEQKPEQKKWIDKITEPFEYLGISAGNYQNEIKLKTNRPAENSLYTILKLAESPE